MNGQEADQLLRVTLGEVEASSVELSNLSPRLEYLPLALVQAAAFIHENDMSVREYLQLLDQGDEVLVDLLSEGFETVGRDSGAPQAVTETLILSLTSLLDCQAIPQEFLHRYINSRRNDRPVNDIQLTKALGILKAFSFVMEEEGGGVRLHRLVQLVHRKWLSRTSGMDHFARAALLTVSQSYPLFDMRLGKYAARTSRMVLPCSS
jgi:hypothetical protein